MKAATKFCHKALKEALGQDRAAPVKPRERHFSISF
jgi:hypothetical protein